MRYCSDAMNEHARGHPVPATYQDVLDAPPHMVAELVDGVLHLQPRPAFPHALAGSSLGVELGGPFQKGRGGPGGWWIIDEPELHFGSDVLVPDIAGWRRERMPAFPDVPWTELAPDWACEVLSPGTRALRSHRQAPALRRRRRRPPLARRSRRPHLEAFALQNGRWVLLAALKDDEAVSLAPFEAISFPLSTLWPD